ncbi:MAG: TerB family tellurite resistance protein [Pseudomonadota bacterium]
MHVVIGLLGSIITVLWLLHRLAEMGIDLGGLNPWAWRRRRAWRKRYEGNPIYTLEKPMEVTALLMAATAKASGEMSSDERDGILAIFRTEFHLNEADASGLLRSSTYLLGQGDEVQENLAKVLAPSQEAFTPDQAASAVELVQRVASLSGEPSQAQAAFAHAVAQELGRHAGPPGKWD